MTYQITFYAVYAWFTIGFASHYQQISFDNQGDCLLYLFEHKETLEQSAKEKYKELKVGDKTYVLEGFNIECDVVLQEV